MSLQAPSDVRGKIKMNEKTKERFFSVELKSKVNLKNVTLTNGTHENVLVEGSLGQLVHAGFAEGVILEVVGSLGVSLCFLFAYLVRRIPKADKVL